MKGPERIIQFNFMTTSGLTKTFCIILSILSKCLLNIDKLEASTIFLGSLVPVLDNLLKLWDTELHWALQVRLLTLNAGDDPLSCDWQGHARGSWDVFAPWAARAPRGLTLSLMLTTTPHDSSHDVYIGKLLIISKDLSLASCKLEENEQWVYHNLRESSDQNFQ